MKRVIVCVAVLCLIAASSRPVYSADLEQIGITAEDFAQFPMEKQMLYSDFHILHSVSETKYYRADEDEILNLNSSSGAPGEMTEVTKEAFDAAKGYARQAASGMEPRIINSDRTSGVWYEMETTVAYAGTTDGLERYSLTVNISIVTGNLGPSLMGNYTAYVAGGINGLCSPVSGSEVFKRVITAFNGGQESEYIMRAPHKGGGCGFDFTIVDMSVTNDVSMTFLFTPLQDLSMIDASGFAGYWNYKVHPNLSFNESGADLSVSPTKNLVEAAKNYVQIYAHGSE